MKLRNLFLNKQTRYQMTWQQLATHYNICVAAGIEERGMIEPNEHDYLQTLQEELNSRLDNPKFILSQSLRTPS